MLMSEKIEINTLITKHENKCKGCRFEMISVEDPLWEYGSPLKRVLIDNQTGETYDSVSKLVGLLNEQQNKISQLEEELEESSAYIIEQRKENKRLNEENEQLREKVTDYEIILSITDDKRTLCKEQQIDDVAFYCERYSDYRCYPLCPNTKDCFEADGTFQEKLKDLKEFWGEKWK